MSSQLAKAVNALAFLVVLTPPLDMEKNGATMEGPQYLINWIIAY